MPLESDFIFDEKNEWEGRNREKTLNISYVLSERNQTSYET